MNWSWHIILFETAFSLTPLTLKCVYLWIDLWIYYATNFCAFSILQQSFLWRPTDLNDHVQLVLKVAATWYKKRDSNIMAVDTFATWVILFETGFTGCVSYSRSSSSASYCLQGKTWIGSTIHHQILCARINQLVNTTMPLCCNAGHTYHSEPEDQVWYKIVYCSRTDCLDLVLDFVNNAFYWHI